MQPQHAPGERFGNYEIKELLGAGGMGAVYRAVHPEIGRTVAIKVLLPELARDEAVVKRFFDEARAANAIRHDGIVDIYDFGRRPDGVVYYVMEHLVGEDLAHVLHREKRLPAARAIALLRQVCHSLGAAHRRGIIHRDLKPQNLFVLPRGDSERMKVLDFGIAKLMGERSMGPATEAGVVMGTVQYMSPEQARADPVDGRADVYSLGCILYELLSGTPPFCGKNHMAVLAQLATATAEPPSRRAPEALIPPALDAVVLRAIAKDASERYLDCEELEAALAAVDLTVGLDLAGTLPSVAPLSAAGATPVPSLVSTPAPEALRRTPPSALEAYPRAEALSGDVPVTAALPPGRALLAQAATLPASASQALLSDEHEADEAPLLGPRDERRLVLITTPVLLGFWLAAFALYFVPPTGWSMNRHVLGWLLAPYGAATLVMAALFAFVIRTQQRSRARWWVNRVLSVAAVFAITAAIHFTGALSSYDILYYPLFVILDRLRAGRSLARLTLVLSIGMFALLLLFEHAAWLAYAPLYPGVLPPAMVQDRGLVLLVFSVVTGITYLSYALTNFLADRVLQRERQLKDLGLDLAGRVEEQLELLRRSEGLRRYVSPQLADLILRGDTHAFASARRRITMVRVDCPALARAVETVDPEELAVLLNAFLGKLADLAVAHGGTVDRIAGAELSVLFGAPVSSGASADALAAVRFARATLVAVRELAIRWEAAGVEELPACRCAVHTGFATVGSFGSPARMEYTAVGPHADAVPALLAGATVDEVLLTHATFVLVRDLMTAAPVGERQLPGARAPVKVYRVEAPPT